MQKPNKGGRICFISEIRYKWANTFYLIPNSFLHSILRRKEQTVNIAKLSMRNYYGWFQSGFFPNFIRSSLIKVGNAAYQKCVPEIYYAIAKLKKGAILSTLTGERIEVGDDVTYIEARKILKDWEAVHIEPEIVTLAKFEGHKMIFTPRYHSNLHPIGLVWGLSKGNIGRSYFIGTTLQDVKENLN